MAEDYTFFAHFLGLYNPATGGPLWGQEDSLPKGGFHPTTLWEPGEAVVDTYQITIPQEAPPGRYRIEVGVYDSSTQLRLPVVETEEETLNNAILLPQEILIQR